MLPIVQHGERGPLLVALHWLGGSADTWTEVAGFISASGCCFVAIDLPGFGLAVDTLDFGIEAMTDAVIETVRELRVDIDAPWLLVAHSMGGKLAAIIARAAEDEVIGLENLAGVILVSPSPPGPEPMKESKRKQMLAALGRATSDANENRARAKKFIDDNTGKLPIVEPILQRSIDDVLKMNREAFAAWLTSGSEEDWSKRVGVLTIPALVMAGTEEEALGPSAQKTHTIPHFTDATLLPLVGSGHLSPLERPYEVAEYMLDFMRRLGIATIPETFTLKQDFQALIDSDYASTQTRAVLETRLSQRASRESGGLTSEELSILKRVVALVIPDAKFDVSSRLQDALSEDLHDGWRFDTLPEDKRTWSLGLRSLDAAATRELEVPFIALDTERQNELLRQVQEGKLKKSLLAKVGLGHDGDDLDAEQMRDWFEDVRAELVKIYISDPRTLERIGFTGFADEKGFTQIRLGEREEFEP